MAPTGTLIGVWTADFEMKDARLRGEPATFVATPHFEGYPIVLVVLDVVVATTLRAVIAESWLARAPKRLATAYLATHASRRDRANGVRE